MTAQNQLTLGILILLMALFAWTTYRWIQSRRVTRVGNWVESFLIQRYGSLPARFQMICTDDQLWPVLVSFDHPPSGNHHRLQFMCSGDQSQFRLNSEQVDQRASIS